MYRIRVNVKGKVLHKLQITFRILVLVPTDYYWVVFYYSSNHTINVACLLIDQVKIDRKTVFKIKLFYLPGKNYTNSN